MPMSLGGVGVLGWGHRLAFLRGLSFGDISQKTLVDYIYFIVFTCIF